MLVFALVLVFQTSVGAAVTTIPSYPSEGACTVAGKKAEKLLDLEIGAWACIPQFQQKG